MLVSGIGYPSSIPGRILGAWRRGAIEVVLSHYILEELGAFCPASTEGCNGDDLRVAATWTFSQFRRKSWTLNGSTGPQRAILVTCRCLAP